MKYGYILLLMLLSLSACKSKQVRTKQSPEMTYKTFRAQQHQFSTPEGNIAYIDKGKGDVIVLLHGVPTSGWLYRHMIDDLAKTHRVIVPDMLGFGSSDSPEGYEIYAEANHAKRLLALMDHLNISNWTHVMHDAGGLWTWELAEIAPQRLTKLIVLNTIIYEEGFDPPIRFEEGILAKTAMWSYRSSLTNTMMLNGLFKSGLTENNLTDTAIEGYKTPLKEGKTKAMYYFFTQTCNTLKNYEATLQKLDMPVAVIWGKNDDFLKWNPQQQRVIKDLDIAPKHITLLEAKHFIQEEQPQKIVKTILKFVEK
jgi:pimeloyl-ACP methyl ester carboxylesterase